MKTYENTYTHGKRRQKQMETYKAHMETHRNKRKHIKHMTMHTSTWKCITTNGNA